jgi:transcriptional regulator with XRE-family HTH domain
MTFGERLRQLMAERDISLRKLAKMIPYDLGNLSKVRNDQKPPSEKLADRLDDLLNAGGELVSLRRSSLALPTSRGELSPDDV